MEKRTGIGKNASKEDQARDKNKIIEDKGI